MTLIKSDSPLTFDTTGSFIEQNLTLSIRFRVYHPATDDRTNGWRRIHVNYCGQEVNTDNLITLYPDVSVSIAVSTKVYTKKAVDCEERKYFFGTKLFGLQPRER